MFFCIDFLNYRERGADADDGEENACVRAGVYGNSIFLSMLL